MITNSAILLFLVACFAVGPVPCQAEMRVSPADAVRAVVKKVQPEYSAMARQLKIQGEVEVEAAVNAEGTVVEVKPVKGNALLTAMAVHAGKEWRFRPFVDDGKPSPALVSLRFDFKL